MSRVAKQNIALPKDVKCDVQNNEVICSGPCGINRVYFPNGFELKIDGDSCRVDRKSENVSSMMWGSIVSNLKNAIAGVFKVFTQDINLVGVGYKAIQKDGALEIHLGYSHPIMFAVPEGVKIELKKANELTLSSHNKQLLGETCSKLEKLRKVEPYKGKGVVKVGKFYVRKEGKKK